MHRWLPTEDSSHALNALKRKQFFLGVIVQNMKGFEGPDSRIGQTLPFPFQIGPWGLRQQKLLSLFPIIPNQVAFKRGQKLIPSKENEITIFFYHSEAWFKIISLYMGAIFVRNETSFVLSCLFSN